MYVHQNAPEEELPTNEQDHGDNDDSEAYVDMDGDLLIEEAEEHDDEPMDTEQQPEPETAQTIASERADSAVDTAGDVAQPIPDQASDYGAANNDSHPAVAESLHGDDHRVAPGAQNEQTTSEPPRPSDYLVTPPEAPLSPFFTTLDTAMEQTEATIPSPESELPEPEARVIFEDSQPAIAEAAPSAAVSSDPMSVEDVIAVPLERRGAFVSADVPRPEVVPGNPVPAEVEAESSTKGSEKRAHEPEAQPNTPKKTEPEVHEISSGDEETVVKPETQKVLVHRNREDEDQEALKRRLRRVKRQKRILELEEEEEELERQLSKRRSKKGKAAQVKEETVGKIENE